MRSQHLATHDPPCRIREALHIDVSLHSLFEATTVAALAELEALSDSEAHRALGQETDLA